MILLIIDAQTIITNEKLYCFEQFVSNVKALLKCARENNIEVVYVRHDDGVGEEGLQTAAVHTGTGGGPGGRPSVKIERGGQAQQVA